MLNRTEFRQIMIALFHQGQLIHRGGAATLKLNYNSVESLLREYAVTPVALRAEYVKDDDGDLMAQMKEIDVGPRSDPIEAKEKPLDWDKELKDD